ncbi:MAG: metallophosphoesterase [Oscillospiraceae bacterium]|nr:metallophosphoesterase [Oscillospiraceae bacterium]
MKKVKTPKIYVTGDTHGDIERFKQPAFRKIRKRDSLIICGDFGFIWDGGNKEKRLLKWLGKRRFDVLFVEGAHENFDELESYEVENWCGGKTRKISGKLRQLMRGQVFEIADKKILTFGGGEPDTPSETPGANPGTNPADYETAMTSLAKADFKVDYIISYEPPTQISEFLALGGRKSKQKDENISYELDEISRKTEFKRWFFGRHHINKIIPPKYFALFDNVIDAEYNPVKSGKK